MCTTVAVTCLIFAAAYAQNIFEHNTTIDHTSDPGKLLPNFFSANLTHLRSARGNIKFEREVSPEYVSFDDQSEQSNKKPFKFEKETYNDNIEDSKIRFDDTIQVGENGITDLISHELQSGNNQIAGHKKKRRRRKPKNQFTAQPGYLNSAYPGSFGPRPGPVPNLRPNFFQPGFNGQFYRPVRLPRPSPGTDALAAVTGALTSIAQNDDYQCVARLLCEAAAGGALGSSSLLDSVSGLQPLLTLLSAYNGISSNPLFVFGRAAFLGISSKENPGSCRYAYPICPTDPEQLVHYLNNHNGGFFRFFNTPQHGQQNLEQFYNQLSQNYGFYQPQPGNHQDAQHYGFLNPTQGSNYVGQQPNLYPNGYGFQQNYGLAFPYNQNYNNGMDGGIRFKNNNEIIGNSNKKDINYYENKIEKRILYKPESLQNDISKEHSSKWLFPGEDDDDSDESNIGVQYVNSDDFNINENRKDKTIRFPDGGYTYTDYNSLELDRKPEDNQYNSYKEESNRNSKGISFPEGQIDNYGYTYYNNYPVYSNDNDFVFKNVRSAVSHNYNDKEESGATTVYVVRGNGDPSKPEIVKLRPGETL